MMSHNSLPFFAWMGDDNAQPNMFQDLCSWQRQESRCGLVGLIAIAMDTWWTGVSSNASQGLI